MSTTVDNRIVNMQFNNKDFEKGVKQTVQSLDNLKKSLDIKTSAESIKEVQKQFNDFKTNRMEKALETVQRRFSLLGEVGAAAIHKMTNAVIDFGTKAIRETLISPLTDGLREYELKMSSVQNIMNGTGESLERVSEKLNALNQYSDKTIYSFSDMTSNIAKFTNAGVKLDDAVDAIQGVANVAALSGANAEQASHAMYNFAQALSSGSVKLIDWKSIENANMATQEFKNTLIETALELGTVVKEGNKYITTTKNANDQVSDAFDAMRGFNDSLNHQWMTSEVLTKALAKYTDETTTLGKRAFAAATEVKTFSQLLDTLKEALGSGWASSWELIIGNFNEAKQLWTQVNNVLSGLINSWDDWRNGLLEGWRELKGREQLIVSIKNAFYGLLRIITPIKQAFLNIFPPITAQMLKDMTDNLYNFIRTTMLSNSGMTNLRRIFQGLFSVVKFVAEAFQMLVEVFGYVSSDIIKLLAPFATLLGYFGNYITNVIKMAEQSGILTTIANGLALSFHTLAIMIAKTMVAVSKYINRIKSSKSFNSIIKSFKSLFNTLHSSVPIFDIVLFGIDRMLDGLLTLSDVIFNLLPNFDTIIAVLQIVGYTFLIVADGIINGFTKAFNVLKNIFTNMTKAFSQVVTWFNNTFKKFAELFINFEPFKILNEAIKNSVNATDGALNSLGGTIQNVSNIIGQVGSIAWNSFTTIARSISEFLGDDTIFNMERFRKILNMVLITMTAFNFVRFTSGLASIPKAFGKMITEMAKLPAKIGKTFDALTSLIDSWNTDKKGPIQTFSDIIMSLATSLFIISSAITMLSVLDFNKALHGLIPLGALIVGLTTMTLIVNTLLKKQGGAEEGLTSITTAIYDMAKAIFVLSLALGRFTLLYSKDNTNPVNEALRSIILLLLTLGVTAYMMSKTKDIKDLKDLITSMGTSIFIMVLAIEKLAVINFDKLGFSVLAVIGLMGMLTLLIRILSEAKIYNLVGASKSLMIFTGCIAALGAVAAALSFIDAPNLWNSVLVITAIGVVLDSMFLLLEWASAFIDFNVPAILATVASLLQFVQAMTILSAAVGILSFIPKDQLLFGTQIMIAMGSFLVIAAGLLAGVVVLINKFSVGGVIQLMTVVEALRNLVFSIVILLVAAGLIGKVMNKTEIDNALTVVMAFMGSMGLLAAVLGVINTASVLTGSIAMLAMTTAIDILVGGAIILANQDWKKMSKAVFYIVAFAGILGLMAYTMTMFTSSIDILATGGAMIMMATSVLILAGAVMMLATIDPRVLDKSVQALLSMGVILLGLSVGMALINKFLMADNILTMEMTIGMVISMAGAIVILSAALTILQNVNLKQIQGGIIALIEVLIIMTAVVALCGLFAEIAIPGIIALAGIAAAILAVSVAFKILENINWLMIPGTVASAMLATAAAFSGDLIINAIGVLIDSICYVLISSLPKIKELLITIAKVILELAIDLVGWIGNELCKPEVQKKIDNAVWSLVFGAVGTLVSLVYGPEVGSQIASTSKHFVNEFGNGMGEWWNRLVANFTSLLQTGVEWWLGVFGFNSGGIKDTPSYKAGRYFLLSLGSGFKAGLADAIAPIQILMEYIGDVIEAYSNFNIDNPLEFASKMATSMAKFKKDWDAYMRGEKVTEFQITATSENDKIQSNLQTANAERLKEMQNTFNKNYNQFKKDTKIEDKPIIDSQKTKKSITDTSSLLDDLANKYKGVGNAANVATENNNEFNKSVENIGDNLGNNLGNNLDKAYKKTTPKSTEAGKDAGKGFLDGMEWSLEGIKTKGSKIAEDLKGKLGSVVDNVKGLTSGEKSLMDIDLKSFIGDADKLNEMFGGKVGFLSDISESAKEFTNASNETDVSSILKGMNIDDIGSDSMFKDMFSDKKFQDDFKQNTGSEITNALNNMDVGKVINTDKFVDGINDKINSDVSTGVGTGVKIDKFDNLTMKDILLDDSDIAKNFGITNDSLDTADSSLKSTDSTLDIVDTKAKKITGSVISANDVLGSIERILVKIANKLGVSVSTISNMTTEVQGTSDAQKKLNSQQDKTYNTTTKTVNAMKSMKDVIGSTFGSIDTKVFENLIGSAKKANKEYGYAKKLIDEYEADHDTYILKRMRDTGKDAVELSKEIQHAYDIVKQYDVLSTQDTINKANESGKIVGKAFGSGIVKNANEVFANNKAFFTMLTYNTEDFEKDFADDGELNASIRPVIDSEELKKATDSLQSNINTKLDTNVTAELANDVVLDYHKELGTIISGVDKLGILIGDLKETISSINIVMDNGVLVGQVSAGVQTSLANSMIMSERGAK